MEFLSTVKDVRVLIPKIIHNNILSLAKAHDMIKSSKFYKSKTDNSKRKVSLKKKKSNDTNINDRSKEANTNINIFTNNHLNCFCNMNDIIESQTPQISHSTNILHNTHLMISNETYTTKNRGNINQLIGDGLANTQLSKRTKLLVNYSSLIEHKERDLNTINMPLQITIRNKRPISSLINQLTLKKSNEPKLIVQTPLSKSLSQVIELSSHNQLRPSSSYSTLFPIASVSNN